MAGSKRHRIGELADIEPLHVAAYIETPQATAAKPTVKQHLAAIRMLFDTSTLVGLRDHALIGVMTYAFARIGAVVATKVEDYYPAGKRWWAGG